MAIKNVTTMDQWWARWIKST